MGVTYISINWNLNGLQKKWAGKEVVLQAADGSGGSLTVSPAVGIYCPCQYTTEGNWQKPAICKSIAEAT
jgi:hypothetical protein